MLGESSLHRSDVPWTRHVGNVRVIVDPQQRGRGLSRLLLAEICAVAEQGGIERLVAEMMAEQASRAADCSSGSAFVRRGATRRLPRDSQGKLHDLVVMTAGRPEMERIIAHEV